eukprot:CAMPEP_0179080986 /NCGR_PEP_ID=MMETSP0796-20121207/36433_1 /TAXON_ID=73915 /ORGANISM="Pyrodinium bahamense, Strain pbaha01" /LENGTH=783 /DNA_ID=CAMNT_0020778355 /DNA_START=57 /DNA_END=2408 /DNA_ORIENTATION=-
MESSRRRRRTSELGGARDGKEEPHSGGVPVFVLVRCRPVLTGVAVVQLSAEAKGPSRVALCVDPVRAAANPPPAEPSYAREKGRVLEARSFRCNAFLDESSSQEDVFKHAVPVVDRVMEGYNGTIFCYGITGSGKSYTMSGLAVEQCDKGTHEATVIQSQGIVQRAATRIFEFIRDRSEQGQVFSVEASFLEIYSNDGVSETLVDLLVEGGKNGKCEAALEIHQDPLNKQAFVCEGLNRVPIGSPDEMCKLLDVGRRRCTFMETSRNCLSSRSHCLFIVTVECLADHQASVPTSVRRGKLVLVDLAGSESLKKVMAANDDNESLRRRQAIGINRVLSHLGTVVNNLNAGSNAVGYRNSALTMLLRDCLGGAACALLVANIGPEAEWCSETFMTLTFAQKMLQVRNVEKQTFVDQSQSTLLRMRQRHQECIERLKESAQVNNSEMKDEEWQKLQSEVKELNGRLLTKSNVTVTLERLQEEQKRKMDELRDEMTQAMANQFATLQEQSLRDFDELRQVIELKTREGGEIVERQWRASAEAQLKTLQAELETSLARGKAAIGDVAQLRVQLGAAEEKVQLLQELQQDVARERADLDQERRSLQQQADEQRQRFLSLDCEANKYRVEANVMSGRIAELKEKCTDDAAAAHAEREAWTAREGELRATLQSKREKLDAERSQARERATGTLAEHRDVVDKLRGQIMRLEAEGAVQQKQLEDAQHTQTLLEEAVREVQERGAALQHQLEEDAQLYDEELEEANHSVQELIRMLDEVQGSIIKVTSKPQNR